MTRYTIDVAVPLLEQAGGLDLPDGFRFIEVGDLDGQGRCRRVLVEDAAAPQHFEGRHLDLTFSKNADGTVGIIDRRVVELHDPRCSVTPCTCGDIARKVRDKDADLAGEIAASMRAESDD